MALQFHIAETGTLICDGVDVGSVEIMIAVFRIEATGQTTASGYLKAGENVA